MKMKKRIILITLYLGISIHGCTPVDRPPLVIRSHHLNLVDMRIVNGKTTKEDILKWLGEPDSKDTDNLGREKWIYSNAFDINSIETRLDVTFKDGVIYWHLLNGSID
jgi:hypothetical protein